METENGHWKRSFEIGNIRPYDMTQTRFRHVLEQCKNVDWKHEEYIHYLYWKQKMDIGNDLQRLETLDHMTQTERCLN